LRLTLAFFSPFLFSFSLFHLPPPPPPRPSPFVNHDRRGRTFRE
jgi:hypothetical protein